MAASSVIHDTFVLERSYPKPIAKVFAAFQDPAIKRRWYAEGEKSQVQDFALDFRVGGTERVEYRFPPGSPFPGTELLMEGVFLEILEGKRIVEASTMAMDGRRFSASLATFEMLPSATGTELTLIHQGTFFEGSDGPEMRKEGWRKLLDKLGSLLGS